MRLLKDKGSRQSGTKASKDNRRRQSGNKTSQGQGEETVWDRGQQAPSIADTHFSELLNPNMSATRGLLCTNFQGDLVICSHQAMSDTFGCTCRHAKHIN